MAMEVVLNSVINTLTKEVMGVLSGNIKEKVQQRKNLSKKVYVIYTNLKECQEAYLEALRHEDPLYDAEYHRCLKKFGNSIRDILDLLAIYDPGLHWILVRYHGMSRPEDIMGHQVDAALKDQADYELAKEALEHFIKANIKIEDLV